MILISKLFSIVMIILGCMLVMKKETFEKIIAFAKEEHKIYLIAVLRILLGIIFMSASTMSRIVWIVFLMGMIFVVAGVLPFILKKDKTIEFIEKAYADKTSGTLRIIALMPIVVGALMLIAL